MRNKNVFQFKITLLDVKPAIWRRIQITDSSTFWDFHVAIQNVMGWTDSHLHKFSVKDASTLMKESIGIPDDKEFSEYLMLAGWEVKIIDYITSSHNKKFSYLYDFGDSWEHEIEFEGEYEKLATTKYPKCIDGARACPPEDVGGTPGYERFLEAIKDPHHEEHEELLEWVDGKFDPEKFDAKKVKFQNPKSRWKQVFQDDIEF